MNAAVHELAGRDRELKGLALLLDPTALGALVGAPARIRHVRYKPGTSLLASFDTTHGSFWAGVWQDGDKAQSARRRSSAVSALPGIAHSALGPARSDRVLITAITRAERAEPALRDASVVRHNPGRRLVLRTRHEYVKTAPGRADAALQHARRLQSAGIPTVEARRICGDHTWASPAWGSGDLASHPSVAHATAAGATLARVHAHSSSTPVDETTDARAASAVRAVRTVLPALGDRAHALSLHRPVTGRRTLVHGDFSADQVLVDGRDEVRLIDLDRMGTGDPARDLATFAVEEHVRTGGMALTEALFAAYRTSGGTVSEGEWRSWMPLCALERAIEPFRHCEQDWPAVVESRLHQAGEYLS